MASAWRGLTLRTRLRGVLLLGLVLLGVSIGAYTVFMAGELERQAELTTSLVATIAGPVLFSETPDLREMQRLRDVIEEVAFPFVFTDVAGRPYIWNERQVGVPLPESLGDILSADLENPSDPDLRRVLELVAEYDRGRSPIPLYGPGGRNVVGYLHYGPSRLTTQLVWMPWLEAVLIVTFMGAVLLAFRNMKRSEQRSIWVGMAKETAHQMGTPLTSLNGWLALLRDPEARESTLGRDGGPDLEQVFDEIQQDVDRLGKVSSRFSQIGSRPQLQPGRVDEVALRTVEYFRTRLPHLGKQVVIVTHVDPVPEVPISAPLLDWAVENLLKNGLDAIDKDQGRLEVVCRPADGGIEVLVSDNGKGVPAGVRDRIFDPGFSTKQRGWGMGLALVRRIVEEVHGGQVGILRSVEGGGTTFRIHIPA